MKYLKKIFEADQSNLQSAIDAYNGLLAKDEVWNNFYNKIDLENKDPKFLNDICEFGENRLKEIKIEKEEDIQLVKDLAIDYLEDCKSFDPGEFKVRGIQKRSGYEIELTLVFLKKCMEDRRVNKEDYNVDFHITENETMDYWEKIIQLFKVLKSNGFESNIRYYQPNGVEMKIIIQKKDEN